MIINVQKNNERVARNVNVQKKTMDYNKIIEKYMSFCASRIF